MFEDHYDHVILNIQFQNFQYLKIGTLRNETFTKTTKKYIV